jgi:DNA-binding response OmpR family regulator
MHPQVKIMVSNFISILIADDNIDDRLSLRETLEARGFVVFEAADSNEAYAKAATDIPDLIILDVGMPPDDGFTVCKRIRSNSATSGIPILMLTCHGMVEERTTGLNAGADDYVIKPCDNDELVARISALFRRYPPKISFFERIEHAHRSIEAAETYRRSIVVLNVDVKGSSVSPATTNEEYQRKLTYRDYHTIVEEAVSISDGTKVAWAGDGGTSEFMNAEAAVSAALLIFEKRAQNSRVSDLVIRIGIASGLELLEPKSEIGKRTSQTHNRAGHYQKYANYNKLTIGKEIYDALSDQSRFEKRSQIDGEELYESK